MAKRLILLFTCIFIFSTSTYSFANSKENIVNGDLSIEDGASSALPSETDQIISEQKLKEIDSLLQESTSTAMSKSSINFISITICPHGKSVLVVTYNLIKER